MSQAFSIGDAILLLDPDGGWDWERPEWTYPMIRALREAEEAEYVQRGVWFELTHWRLTDYGIRARKSS